MIIFLLLSTSLIFNDVSAGWRLVWSDEFNGNSLDRTKWDIEMNCWGGGNAEQQCYTDSARNIYVRDGSLHLRAIKETIRGIDRSKCTSNNENSCGWTKPTSSGRIRTLRGGGSWKYGKFEIRAKMPRGDFLWPAIWMLPTDWKYGGWAASGEIDIYEGYGQRPYNYLHTLHYGGAWPNNRHKGSSRLGSSSDLTTSFHTYTAEWRRDSIKFYFDGRLSHTENLNRNFYSGSGSNPYTANRQPFDQRFHMLLNVAVAGNFFNPNEFGRFDINRSPSTWVRPEMVVDYVRVYEETTGTPVGSFNNYARITASGYIAASRDFYAELDYNNKNHNVIIVFDLFYGSWNRFVAKTIRDAEVGQGKHIRGTVKLPSQDEEIGMETPGEEKVRNTRYILRAMLIDKSTYYANPTNSWQHKLAESYVYI